MSTCLPVVEMSGVGAARRNATAYAEARGFSKTDAGRVALVVTEAATNLVQHARGGELLLRSWATGSPAYCVEILALDKGPGMRNVTACMRDGFSTGGSRGAGLGAIARLSTTFEAYPGLSQKSPSLIAAVLYRDRGGKVTFSLDPDGPTALVVRVSDSGPGITNLTGILNGTVKSQTGLGVGLVGSKKLPVRGNRVEPRARRPAASPAG